MKLMMKHTISNSEADRLIERYYDGLTTVEEENQLQHFLSQSALPERYGPEQAIFGYFFDKKQKKNFSIFPYVRWASVAAVLFIAVFSIKTITTQNQTNYAFVDGEKITDIQEVKSQAMSSLKNISSENDEVEEGLKNLNGNKLMEQQLDVFSGLE